MTSAAQYCSLFLVPCSLFLVPTYNERDTSYDVLVEMAADGAHAPEKQPSLLSALDSADLALGSRWVSDGDCGELAKVSRTSLPRWQLLHLDGSGYAPWAPLGEADATGGYRACRRSVLQEVNYGRCFLPRMLLPGESGVACTARGFSGWWSAYPILEVGTWRELDERVDSARSVLECDRRVVTQRGLAYRWCQLVSRRLRPPQVGLSILLRFMPRRVGRSVGGGLRGWSLV